MPNFISIVGLMDDAIEPLVKFLRARQPVRAAVL